MIYIVLESRRNGMNRVRGAFTDFEKAKKLYNELIKNENFDGATIFWIETTNLVN